METTRTLTESLLLAKQRYQPYLNLVNTVYKVGDLLADEHFETYKSMELKSLYFQVDRLMLNEELGIGLQRLTDIGLKEVLIFCGGEESKLNVLQLNDFLSDYKIRINFKIVQLSKEEFAEIRQDSIGKKDLLGFTKMTNHSISYKDGFRVSLLNDERSDELILNNSKAYREASFSKNTFVVEEPDYISAPSDTNAEKRIKAITLESDQSQVAQGLEIEVSKNIDASIKVDETIEQENEIDVGMEQSEHKLSEWNARSEAARLVLTMFREEYLMMDMEQSQDSEDSIEERVRKIFSSDSRIKYITTNALRLVVKYPFLFRDGIDTGNMPIGLAFKGDTIFASDQRVSLNNDFTVQLEQMRPIITNPLLYSWLNFATKGSISLNDLYGTDIAPNVKHHTMHPAIDRFLSSKGVDDLMMDLPYNQVFSRYDLDEISNEPVWTNPKFWSVIEHGNITVHREQWLPKNLVFYDPSESDKQRLQEIQSNLEQRGILGIFQDIVRFGRDEDDMIDGSFLLEEKASMFFKKLFKEILPISDTQKINFFRAVLSGQKFSRFASIDNIFEALDGCYKRLKELLIKENIDFSSQLEEQFVSALKQQTDGASNFKALLKRTVSIMELSIENGGNLKEQIHYLVVDSLVEDSHTTSHRSYLRAKKLKLNVIHEPTLLCQKAAVNELSVTHLVKMISTPNVHNVPLCTALAYVSSLQPHQRASIDSYSKFLKDMDEEINGCYSDVCLSAPGVVKDSYNFEGIISLDKYGQIQHLKAVEYISLEVIPYSYHIKYQAIPHDHDFRTRYGGPYIILNDNDYAVYKYVQIVPKANITLPAVLDERIREWSANGKVDNFIKLTASEVAGTYFAGFVTGWALQFCESAH
ncbi:hypothetical protein EDM53_05770 [Rickettsiales endosymbiont of Peranema trichophorum]|uniref:hypothetical protein n=1 Tax=Rickettsiales endosymbiont of Peranema trichophorum TaxID=2486577 RepID=UPI0010237383|nr:hypothetical protein [Rickettsiales endosymbiont of Peranema trichophorum]RZI45168.1 hypothetical protein EDM53_05770 [Rickettsiales endosymbiont of Peranema trichophorum]